MEKSGLGLMASFYDALQQSNKDAGLIVNSKYVYTIMLVMLAIIIILIAIIIYQIYWMRKKETAIMTEQLQKQTTDQQIRTTNQPIQPIQQQSVKQIQPTRPSYQHQQYWDYQ